MQKNILHIAIEALAIPLVCIIISYRSRGLAHLTKWVFFQWSDFMEHVTRLVGNQKNISIFHDLRYCKVQKVDDPLGV